MMQVELFFGYSIDKVLEGQMKHADPRLISHFIGDKSEYLQKIVYEDQSFLGKMVNEVIDLEELVLLEANLQSLLKKLMPEATFQAAPVLFPLEIKVS